MHSYIIDDNFSKYAGAEGWHFPAWNLTVAIVSCTGHVALCLCVLECLLNVCLVGFVCSFHAII